MLRENTDIPTPGDVVVTKTEQLILKFKTKSDSEKLKSMLVESEIKDKIKLETPRRKRKRLLIVVVDSIVAEKEIVSVKKNYCNKIG